MEPKLKLLTQSHTDRSIKAFLSQTPSPSFSTRFPLPPQQRLILIYFMSSSSSSSCPMDAVGAKNQDKGGAKKKQSKSLSSWRTMALMKNRRSQPGGESKSSSSEKKKMSKSINIGRSMACGGSSICSTKESSVLNRESRRRSTSSRSLKAPDNGAVVVPVTAAAVSASSSFNSETSVATTTTTATSVDSSSSTLSSSALSSPLSSVGVSRSFRKLSGCYYECHSAVDPRTSLDGGSGGSGASMLSCADCDEFFTMEESLELHRATKHAVSELGADDTSRNVVEIIFRSSWLTQKLQSPVCRIERVLKVQSSGKAVERFEQYRERVKARAASSSDDDPRCAADGNELLRFHCTTFRCSLGLAGATSLCRTTSPQRCKLCGIIRDGFRADGDGDGDGKIATMATSGRAHDTAQMSLPADGGDGGEKWAMLVCRVVAGRVKKVVNGSRSSSADQCGSDSVSYCSDLDELFVFNPRAILPCFVVIYGEN